MGSAPPGWYPDPETGSTGVRYWDGWQWTNQTAPAAPPPTFGWQPPPSTEPHRTTTNTQVRMSTWVTALLVVVSLVVVAAVGIGVFAGDDSHSSAGPAATAPSTTIKEPPPDFQHGYHPTLDANGAPELVKFSATGPTIATAAVPHALFALPAGPDVVDPATARSVVQTLWAVRSTAIAQRNATLLRQFETGSALAVDADRGCSCSASDRFGTASAISVSVPHQHVYPAHFFAQLRTTLNGTAWDPLLVFTRSTPTDPWRLEFAGGGQPVGGSDAMFPLALAADGFAVDDGLGTTRPAALPDVASLLARYWQQAKDEGDTDLPASLAPATLTNQWAATLAQNRQGEVNSANGLFMYYRFTRDLTAHAYAVPLAGGSELECMTVQEQKTYVPTRGEMLTQPTARTNWGADVAPGSYAAMITVSDYTPCFQYQPGTAYYQANGVTPGDVIASVPIP